MHGVVGVEAYTPCRMQTWRSCQRKVLPACTALNCQLQGMAGHASRCSRRARTCTYPCILVSRFSPCQHSACLDQFQSTTVGRQAQGSHGHGCRTTLGRGTTAWRETLGSQAVAEGSGLVLGLRV